MMTTGGSDLVRALLNMKATLTFADILYHYQRGCTVDTNLQSCQQITPGHC